MQYFTKTANYTKPESGHKLCIRWGSITLQQKGKDNFLVRYGMQVDSDLTYSEAASKLGESIMHELACDGWLDNRSKGKK